MKQKINHSTRTHGNGHPKRRKSGIDIHSVKVVEFDTHRVADQMLGERRQLFNAAPVSGIGKMKRHPDAAAVVAASIRCGVMIPDEDLPVGFQCNNQGHEARARLVAAIGSRRIDLTS